MILLYLDWVFLMGFNYTEPTPRKNRDKQVFGTGRFSEKLKLYKQFRYASNTIFKFKIVQLNAV